MAGKGQMPAFGASLSLPKMQALSGYVRRLGADSAPPGANAVTVRRAAVALAAVCLFLGAAEVRRWPSRGTTSTTYARRAVDKAAANVRVEGTNHLKRANALAGEGDCKAAIDEYTKASELLDDPVVLFNRGECYRRTGDGENAVDDYREFLEKLPSAPNRADIEAKIAGARRPRAGGAHIGRRREAAPPPLEVAGADAGADGGSDAPRRRRPRWRIRAQRRDQARARGRRPEPPHQPMTPGPAAAGRPGSGSR